MHSKVQEHFHSPFETGCSVYKDTTEVLFTKMSSVYADDYENLELHFSEGTFVVADFVCLFFA